MYRTYFIADFKIKNMMSQNYLVNKKLTQRQDYLEIIDDDNLLKDQQKEELQENSYKKFTLGNYSSLCSILTECQVKVHIVPGTPERIVPGFFEEIKKHWEDVAKRIKEENHPLVGEAEKEYGEALRKAAMAEEEKKNYQSMSMLGCYCPQDNIIKLFPKNMDQNRMEEQLVSTLAHEVMHAYFNRPGHESFPYVYFVEEPLAEFGMLCYLKETNSPFYKEAYEDVKNKNTCYRYGAHLMDQYLSGDESLRGYLEAYKIKMEQWEIPEFPEDEGGVIILPRICQNASASVNVPCKYDCIWSFDENGLCQVRNDTEDGYRYGFVNRRGQEQIPVIYEHTYSFENGVTVAKKNGAYGIIDEYNNTIHPFTLTYQDVRGFRNGYATAKKGEKWGAINTSGDEVVPCVYDSLVRFSKDGIAEVKKDGREFRIDIHGNELP